MSVFNVKKPVVNSEISNDVNLLFTEFLYKRKAIMESDVSAIW